MVSLASLVMVSSFVAGQTEGEKAFTSLADFMVGGVWTTTVDGVTSEESHKRVLNNRFVQVDLNSSGTRVTLMIGVDPVTKNCTCWGFDGQGGVVKWTVTQETDDVWKMEGRGMGPEGEYALKDTLTRMDENTLKEEVASFTVNGKPRKGGTAIWRRKR